MKEDDARNIAGRISAGHAWETHVLRDERFPEVKTHDDFFTLIFDVLTNPSATSPLRRNREAFWSDAHQTLVIVDYKSEDYGTAFRPAEGKRYFNALRKRDEP
ncbi:hypothetical protein [Paracidobacterium acidisoli]|uniref:Uncharacterized protein n=1 Tax=Paracidobacterium acidisoli TaxID=2303751 RepID=A0A372IS64_9BACT|nr:hypothetical protein [Paracidobacterium acidisoli]MBT9330694.1 hypothetical protein [Paracidobacterium acidisoli]